MEKKQDNPINNAHKGLNVNVNVCTAFFFIDASATMKGTINYLLKLKVQVVEHYMVGQMLSKGNLFTPH